MLLAASLLVPGVFDLASSSGIVPAPDLPSIGGAGGDDDPAATATVNPADLEVNCNVAESSKPVLQHPLNFGPTRSGN